MRELPLRDEHRARPVDEGALVRLANVDQVDQRARVGQFARESISPLSS
ncbi:hypothetical protein ACIQ8D_23495 [Streptomyces sp. NPDC096094]